jgi:hypothetical protein
MLGAVRTLLVVPRVGTWVAELMEIPIMLVVTIVVSRWVVLRLLVPFVRFGRLGMGGIAPKTFQTGLRFVIVVSLLGSLLYHFPLAV